jgi:hypothetical protein
LGIVGVPVGGERRALQTHFPTSRIELRGCDQLGWRSLHDADEQTSLERTEGGKPKLCLHANYLKHSETGISERIENFFLNAILPKLLRERDHATHETLELAERESPFG